MTTSVDYVSKLELAAQIVMASPEQVTVQDRKDAEALFMQLREGALSVETCRQILETTQNQFFMFELARALVARMLKEWSKYSIEDVRNIIAYLLNFSVNHSNLPNFVSTEMFHSAAKIIKRSSLAMVDIFPSLIANLENLLSNENPQLQTYGLQTIELISTEFLSAWRSSNISISWDFHLRAKKQFEDILLKQLLELSLRTLSNLLNSSDLSSQLDQQICDKFLRVASLIFCWNFSPKYLYLHFKILISALRSNTFRPPESWHDIFRDTTIITFFMELHSRVRYNEQLCQNSMLCLTQLSSLMGDALGPSGPIVLILPQVGAISERRLATSMGGGEEVAMEKGAGDKKVLHDHYVQLFSQHLIELFSNFVLDYEMAPLSLVIYKLITCHPMAIFERFPKELLTKFIDFIVANILRLTQPAMDLALKNDQTYHEPLTNLFQVWRTILRSSHMFNEEIGKLIGEWNTAIIDAFIKSVLSPPFGTRTKPSNEEIFEENEDDEDDRTVFMDVLCDVGFFSLNSIDFFVDYISKSMVQRLGELHSVNLESINQEHLQIWQEDFHWLLLLTGYFIRQPAYSNIGNFPEELAIRCLNGFKEGEFARLDDFEPLFTQCINNPPFDPSTYPQKLDPITLISTQILSWFSMEHQMLTLLDPNASLLSPALCQTSLWQFSLLMIVLTPNSPNDSIGGGNPWEENGEEEDEKLAQQWKDMKYLPSISLKSQLSAKIIQMALEKLFTILSKMSGEKRLCTDVIELLINFAEYRSEELAKNDHLYLLLSKLHIENLSIRRQFVKSLVVIGSSVESNEVRERMNELILKPLRTRFLDICQKHQSGQTTESQLADYFECFTGVADAGQADNAPILFKFLEPIFDYCVPLIQSKTSFQLLIVTILEFIKSTTDVLFFYVESRGDTMAYYNLLVAIINAYKETQLQRFSTFSSGDEEEEQQTQDLTTLIEILCLSISKTYLPFGETGNNALESAKVSLHGLETLLPLMSEDLLKVPQLCTSFFRLLIFISDIAPGALIQVSEQMLNGVFGCVQMALENIFGIERVRSALEIVTNLCTFCLSEIQKSKSSLDNFMAINVLKLIPKIFELAMQFSCEMDIFNEATGALYSMLQLDSETFRAYIGQLLSLPANQDTKPQLEKAFTKLLTFSEKEFAKQRAYTASRKRNFQNKFQEFLVEVSGSLCLN